MRAPKGRLLKRRASIWWRLFGGIGVFVIVLLIAALGLKALISPERVTDLAKQQISRLAGEGYSTNINSASLNFLRNGLAGLEIEGVSVRNVQSDSPLLEGGKASFAISLISLLSGKIQLTDLKLADATMQIEINPGQNSAMSDRFLGPDGLVDPALISNMLETAASTVSSRFAANPELIIDATNIKLIIGKRENGNALLIEKLTALKAQSGEYAFEAAISNEQWKTNLRGGVGQIQANGEMTPYRLTLDQIPFSRTFAPQLPDLKPRSCNGFAGFSIAASKGIASVDVSLSKANCSFAALGDYAISAEINGNLKRGKGIFEVGRGVITVNRSVFNFDGAFAPARYTPKPEIAGETPRYRYELVFAPSTMDSLDNTLGPLLLTGKIAGTYAPTERRLALDEFAADANGSIVRGAASILFTDLTPAVYLALTTDKIPVTDFKRIWPRFAAATARSIVLERLAEGTLRNMRLELQLPPGTIGTKTPLQREQLTASADLDAVTFTTFGDLPPVRRANGSVRFDGVAVDVQIEDGIARLANGDEAEVKPSSFQIANTRSTPVAAELKVALSGTAKSLAGIAALKPIAAFEGQGFLPSDISGKASANGQFQLILVPKGQKVPVPIFDVNVDVENISIAKPINGQTISNASGTIKASNAVVTIRLDAELNGLPARVIITEPRATPEKRTQEIALTLTDAWRKKNVPGLAQFLNGPVTAKIKGSSRAANVELDLTKATLRILPFNWEKGAGIGATAKFGLQIDGAKVEISDLEFSGRGFSATGKAQLDDGTLQSADLRNIRLNPGDNFSLSLKKQGKNINVALGGNQFDARSLMKQILPGRQPQRISGVNPIEINGKIKRLIGFNDEVVLNANVKFLPGNNAALLLTGDFESGGAIDLARSGGGNGKLTVQTGNAGAALRFVDLYKRMIGGRLAVNFNISVEGEMQGPVSINEFTVIGEPRLAKLVSEQAEGSASLREATQAKLASEKAEFELAQGDLVLQNGTIRLKRGIVRGSNVGATAEGIILSATGQMDLRGTFMPARGLNRIVGAIPILGLLLGSGGNAGLIGITYQLAGDAKNPRVFVNPISMIAPGVFRQIFE